MGSPRFSKGVRQRRAGARKKQQPTKYRHPDNKQIGAKVNYKFFQKAYFSEKLLKHDHFRAHRLEL
jgi:hypothetical protein